MCVFYILEEARPDLYSQMLKYETIFGEVLRTKVSYFGENFYTRSINGQAVNQKLSYFGVSYFSMQL